MNRRDLAIGLALLGLAIVFLAPVTLGGRVLVPYDDLFRIPPWKSFASQFGVSVPHNELVLDLLAENLVWKQFIVESLRARELPLWNPYLFAGVPFLAAGQHSALYPFSVLFYILPVDRAFGYFTALQLAIAAATMYAFGRVLRLSRFAALIGAVVYAFSTFMVVSTTFPMVLGAAAWLPGILACFEFIARDSDRSARLASRTILAALVGALLVGLQFLAGHIEISIYILIVSGLYALWRLAIPPLLAKKWPGLGQGLILTAGVLGIGIAIGSVQWVPLYELAQQNFRSGSASYQDVVGWAYPPRQLVTFLIPDFYGNPARHTYFDPFDLTTRPVPNDTIDWGKKNYVESGSYLGILPLLLAAVAVFALFRRSSAGQSSMKSNGACRAAAFFFAGLAFVSLLFIFGTPLYAVLFFLVPGFDQLHTPFRWVFPYTLSMAVLAGIGTQILVDQGGRLELPLQSNGLVARFGRIFPWIFVWSGAAILAALGLALVFRSLTLSLADRLVRSSNLASAAFGSGQTFFSYEFRNIFLFGLLLLGAGAVLRISRCPINLPERLGRHAVWKPLALVLIIVDLFVIGFGFYPASDPKIADFTPPALEFLRQDHSYYRITSYDGPDAKVLNPNVGMLYHLSDIRGYDSIIPRQYANLMGALAPQDQLLDNRIAPFYNPDPLSSPIVNLLNVKYVLTERPVPNAGYTLVYDQEIKIYRNDNVLPRAFVVPQARVISNRAALLEEMKRFDPTREVLLDQNPELEPEPVTATTCGPAPVSIKSYTGTKVAIESTQDCPGWLVLSDSYFPGWLAELDGHDVPLYRADYNFRAVYLPQGTHSVLFKYSPLSLRVGVIGSFLGGMLLLLAFAYLGWRRFYHPDAESQIQLVAKNSLLPMATSLLMKGVNLVYAAFTLRILGPTGNGRYTWAISIWLLASTITDFGLGILLTREVSRDRSQANRYLISATILRVLLWIAALVPIGLVAAIYVAFYHVTFDTAATLGFLVLGILPSTLAASLAFLFNAYERFEYRVAVDVLSSMVQITLGVIVLLLGFGYVGLAASTIFTNLFTLGSLYYLVRTRLFVLRWQVDWDLTRTMVSESYPLMLNNLLSSIFFRVDTLILQPFRGDTELGYYGTAYSFINSLNFIPSSFTLAIFPALARLAASAKDAMLRAYILSLKLLLWISLPITVGTVFISHELIRLAVGEAYLPHSAIALQLLIIFLPFSYVNSVTHYVLIALGQQRFLTKAFLIGAVFNIAANLIAIPPLGYVGAALVTILSEIVLLIPFYYSIHKNLASIPFAALAWRPVLASGIMGVALWGLLPQVGMLIAIPIAASLYAVLLVALGALGEDERALLRRLLPQRLHPVLRLSA